MKKESVAIPVPRSRFLVVRCNNCGQERIVFSHASTHVKCKNCGHELGIPSGGRLQIRGSIVRVLE